MHGQKIQKVLALLLAFVAAVALLPGQSASALVSADPYYKYQWALKNDGSFSTASETSSAKSVAGIDIGMESAWDLYSAGRPVVIALIDTGVDTANSDLSGHLWVNSGEIAGNGLDDDNNGYIDDVNGWNFRSGNNVLYTPGDDDHGTHCFGTMGAACNSVGIAGICGYTNNIKIMVLKAFSGSTNTGKTSDIIRAIQYAEANGAAIVNLSIGVESYNAPLYDAIKASRMLFIAAAGNRGADSADKPLYPASYDLDNIISVANLDRDGTLHASSNFGASVDIAAPGTSIIGYGGEGQMYYMTGTSMAAPMVTAAAALVYSCCTKLSLAQVRDVLLSSARPLSALAGKVTTGGMLDVAAALAGGARLDAAKSVSFSDVKTSDWFYSYVTELAAAGYVAGYGDGTFRPVNSVTVGEVLALVLTASGNGAQAATGAHWASGYRDKALSLGIADAAEVTELDAAASRLFIAHCVARALKLTPDTAASPFADVDDPYVTALYAAGYVAGSYDKAGNRVFLPDSNVKRSESSIMVWHMVF